MTGRHLTPYPPMTSPGRGRDSRRSYNKQQRPSQIARNPETAGFPA